MPDAEVTLERRQIFTAYKALQHLDTANKEGKPLYNFAGGAAFRLALSKRFRRILDLAHVTQGMQAAIAREAGIQGGGKDEPEKIAKVNADVAKLMESSHTFQMAKLPLVNLDLNTNPIPLWVLADLDWLFSEE